MDVVAALKASSMLATFLAGSFIAWAVWRSRGGRYWAAGVMFALWFSYYKMVKWGMI
jgi:hypothetical protein